MWVGLILVVLMWGIPFYIQHQEKSRIESFMLWLCVGNITDLSRPIPLMACIQDSQYDFPPELQILTAQEREYAVLILSNLRTRLEALYSQSSLGWLTKRPLYNSCNDNLFMFALVDYLAAHYEDDVFLGNQMYDYSSGRSLTPFSLVFYKLFYISYSACSSDRHINPKGEHYSHSEVLASVIRSGRVNFYDFEFLFR